MLINLFHEDEVLSRHPSILQCVEEMGYPTSIKRLPNWGGLGTSYLNLQWLEGGFSGRYFELNLKYLEQLLVVEGVHIADRGMMSRFSGEGSIEDFIKSYLDCGYVPRVRVTKERAERVIIEFERDDAL